MAVPGVGMQLSETGKAFIAFSRVTQELVKRK
jgi:hypothetical protein